MQQKKNILMRNFKFNYRSPKFKNRNLIRSLKNNFALFYFNNVDFKFSIPTHTLGLLFNNNKN